MSDIISRDEVQARVQQALQAIEAGEAAPPNPYPPLHPAHTLWDELLERALVAAIEAEGWTVVG